MINVLWVINAPLPEAMTGLKGAKCESNSTGSWLCALSYAVSQEPKIHLAIVAPSDEITDLTIIQSGNILHYLVPNSTHIKACDHSYERYLLLIRSDFKPDVIHVHGTEYPFFLTAIKIFGRENTVISLQGIISEISKVYLGGIPSATLAKYISIRDLLRRDSVFHQRIRMEKRSKSEIELLKSARYVIGRTEWDSKILRTLNPDAVYFHCDELLRDEFYSGTWRYEGCIPHSIFLSQGYYPIKGLHFLLEAISKISAKYPDISIRIAGPNVMRGDKLKDRLLINGYGLYLSSLICKYSLNGHIHFIGPSVASDIKKELLSANVFISPSIIENSSNSICEAQMLGVPVIASNVGGTETIIQHDNDGILYQYNDTNSLSEHIDYVFESSSSFDNLHEKTMAMARHDKHRIVSNLIRIYESII